MIRPPRTLAAAMLAAMLLLQLLLGAALAMCQPERASPRAIAAAHRTPSAHGAHDAGRPHRAPADETCRRDARSCETATHDAACALASACAPAAIAERAPVTLSTHQSPARPECVLERLTSRDLAPDDPPPRLPA